VENACEKELPGSSDASDSDDSDSGDSAHDDTHAGANDLTTTHSPGLSVDIADSDDAVRAQVAAIEQKAQAYLHEHRQVTRSLKRNLCPNSQAGSKAVIANPLLNCSEDAERSVPQSHFAHTPGQDECPQDSGREEECKHADANVAGHDLSGVGLDDVRLGEGGGELQVDGELECKHASADDKCEEALNYEIDGIVDVARAGKKRNGHLLFQVSWSTGDVSWEPVASFDESSETLLRFLYNCTPKQMKAFKKGEHKRLVKELEAEVHRERTPISAATLRQRNVHIENRFLVLKAAVRKLQQQRRSESAEPEGGDPQSLKEAMAAPDWDKFHEDAQGEFEFLIRTGAMTLVPRPQGKNVIKARWVFKRKRKNGKVYRWRSRLVCRGYAQREGMDYDPAELYAPTMRAKSLSVFLHMCARDGMEVRLCDISKAFVHAKLDEEVYMEQPPLFVEKGKEDYVYRLNNALYGLKQSPRAFSKHLASCLRAAGFVPVDADECFWIANMGKPNAVYALYHVDDVLMASMDADERERKFKFLRDDQKLLLRDEGVADVFLGIDIIYDDDGSIHLSQRQYIEDVAARFHAVSDKQVKSPGLPNGAELMKLSKRDCPANETEAKMASSLPFPSLVGCLIYAVRTRPDVSFAVSDLAQYMSCWGEKHYKQAMHVLRYLYYTRHKTLHFRRGCGEGILRCYVDANYGDSRDAGNNKWRSQGGYLIYLDENLVYWSSKRHRCVALSSMEAEYVEASRAGQDVLWFRRLLADLGMPQTKPTLVYEDNQAAISFSKNHTCHDRSKHIDIRHHWLKEMVSDGHIRLQHISSKFQIADIMTKYLPTSVFQNFRDLMLGGVDSHQPAKTLVKALKTSTHLIHGLFGPDGVVIGDIVCM
jgi:hypothetical protein